MAKYCDVLAPMIYPSHFFGMDGHELPGDAPAHFIAASMDRFRKITAGSGVVIREDGIVASSRSFQRRLKQYSGLRVATRPSARPTAPSRPRSAPVSRPGSGLW